MSQLDFWNTTGVKKTDEDKKLVPKLSNNEQKNLTLSSRIQMSASFVKFDGNLYDGLINFYNLSNYKVRAQGDTSYTFYGNHNTVSLVMKSVSAYFKKDENELLDCHAALMQANIKTNIKHAFVMRDVDSHTLNEWCEANKINRISFSEYRMLNNYVNYLEKESK